MPEAAGPALRVLSYNVRGLRDDLTAMVSLIRSLAPDVVVAQEAPQRFRWRTRCADLAHRIGLVYAGGGLPSLGNLLLVSLRVVVHETWYVQFPLTPGRHMRGAALSRCSVAGTPFVVAGSHLATDPTERPAQAAILAKVLSGLTEPIVLAADVNDTAGSTAWRTLADGRVDAAAAGGREPAPTCPVPLPRERLDVIFVDPRIEVRDCRVVDSPEARRASDHFPIMAELRLPLPAPPALSPADQGHVAVD